ncbi:NPL4 family-domain-containing protein, partial [Baffinella frigidus]
VASKGGREGRETVVLDSVDEELYKQEGTVKLKSTGARTKHGFGDETIETMPVEAYDDRAYDDRVLKERDIKLMSFHAYLRKLASASGGGKFSQLSVDIKLMSFHAYLRKLASASGGGKFSQLSRHDFGSYGAAGGKKGEEKGWGASTVSMSRLPKPLTLMRQKYRHVDRVEIDDPAPLTLMRQKYRHVDRVEIDDPAVLDRFIDAWRQTGAMRYGYLYGTYELDSMVPLGIKALVKAIYEPPQLDSMAPLGIKALVKAIYEPPQQCAADGVNMLDDPNAEAVDKVAAMLGLTKV